MCQENQNSLLHARKCDLVLYVLEELMSSLSNVLFVHASMLSVADFPCMAFDVRVRLATVETQYATVETMIDWLTGVLLNERR